MEQDLPRCVRVIWGRGRNVFYAVHWHGARSWSHSRPNQAAAHGTTARTKHFERWIAYVRDLFQRGIIKIKHITTDQMPADIFTKALPRESFVKFRDFLLGKL